MKTQTWLAQSCQLQLQKIIDDMMLLKGSLISSGEKQELIDIVSSKVAECEFAISDLALLEKNLKHDCEQRRLDE